MARAALRPGLVVLLHKIGQGDARRVVATHVEANGHVQRLEVGFVVLNRAKVRGEESEGLPGVAGVARGIVGTVARVERAEKDADKVEGSDKWVPLDVDADPPASLTVWADASEVYRNA